MCAGSEITSNRHGAIALVAVSTSEGKCILISLHDSHTPWRPVAHLSFHKCPVLSLASNLDRFLFSGATDGSICIWDVGSIAKDYIDATAGWVEQMVSPLHVLHGVHQSGINCIAVANTRIPGEFIGFQIISGGDDQKLVCIELMLNPGFRSTVCDAKNAHSSAVWGLWTDGDLVYSVGLDQKVRCWQVDGEQISENPGDSLRLKEIASASSDVPDPSALCAHCHQNASDSNQRDYWILVAGRGVQALKFIM